MLFRGNFHIKQKAQVISYKTNTSAVIILVEKYSTYALKDKYGGEIFEHIILRRSLNVTCLLI